MRNGFESGAFRASLIALTGEHTIPQVKNDMYDSPLARATRRFLWEKTPSSCGSGRMRAGVEETPCGNIPNPVTCGGCPEYKGYKPGADVTQDVLLSTGRGQHNFVKEVQRRGVPTGD